MRHLCLLFFLLLGLTLSSQAHTVPNLTLEAEFKTDGSYTLRINFDPRLFLSPTPSKLPPVAASWWLDQSEAQRAESVKQAEQYLAQALTLLFSGTAWTAPSYSIQPLDGATSMPLTATTTEVHLLATLAGKVPEAAQDFAVELKPEANAALVLLNSLDGKSERRAPQVIFARETSRPFALKSSP